MMKKYQAGGEMKMSPEEEAKMKRMAGKGGAPMSTKRPVARPTTLGDSPKSQGTRGVDPEDNYGDEDLKSLLAMKKGGKVKKKMPAAKKMKPSTGVKKMKSGGKVRGAGCATKGVRAAKMV